MADKFKTLVIGPGHIGTDLLIKARRSEWIKSVKPVGRTGSPRHRGRQEDMIEYLA